MVDSVEFEIVARDYASTALKEMARKLDETNKKTQENTKHTVGLSDALSVLKGPTGVIAGVAAAAIAASKALDSFANNQIKIHNLSAELDLSVEKLSKVKTQLALAGVESKTGETQVAGLMEKLHGIGAYLSSDEFYKAVSYTNKELANQLLMLTTAGRYEEAFDLFVQSYNKQLGNVQKYYRDISGVAHTTFQALDKDVRGHVQVWQYPQAVIKKYHDQGVDLQTAIDNVWDSIKHHTIEAVTDSMGGVDGLRTASRNIVEEFDKTLATDIKDLKAIIDAGKALMEQFKTGGWQKTPEGKFIRPVPEEMPIGPKVREWLEKFWKNMSFVSEAEAATSFPDTSEETLETKRDSNRLMLDMRSSLTKIASVTPSGVGIPGAAPSPSASPIGDGVGRGTSLGRYGATGVPGGGMGGGIGRDSTGHDMWQPDGKVGLADEKGRTIDSSTMQEAEKLGKTGDIRGLQQLFQRRGYHMSGRACGIVASKYATSAGFAPPRGAAIATSWHRWGEQMSPGDINTPGHPFGSMVATYYHGRYGGHQGQLLSPGAQGGHVMQIVPGTYNEKTKQIGVVDQRGFAMRSISDLDLRFAGSGVVAEAEAKRHGTIVQPQQPPQHEASLGPGMTVGHALDSGGGKIGDINIPAAPEVRAGSGSEYLRKERSWLKDELDRDPALKRFLAGVIAHEQSPGERSKVFEALANRLNDLRQRNPNLTLREYLSRKGKNQFYGPVRRGEINESYLRRVVDPYRKDLDAEIDKVTVGGSNDVLGFTDQGSKGDPNYERELRGPHHISHGELYGDHTESARRYREQQQAKVRESDQFASKADKAISRDAGADTFNKVHAKIEFLNVPEGVKTRADAEGLKMTMTRSRAAPETKAEPTPREKGPHVEIGRPEIRAPQ